LKNYIMVNGSKIELTEAQIKEIVDAYKQKQLILSDVPAGEAARIGDHDFIVLGHYGDETALITRNILEKMAFGDNNNFDSSDADAFCDSFAEDLANLVGEQNLVEHPVDLTSEDGLKDYGTVQRRVSLLTADQYRQYVDILDKHKPDSWWWLATPHSTERHGNDSWVKCVAPSGFIGNVSCGRDCFGVRPFCILKSSIFVSR